MPDIQKKEKQLNKLLTAAKIYLEYWNVSVIPLLKNKRPAIQWEEFQKRKARIEEVSFWFSGGISDNMMVGIVTGKISNLAVLDMDSEEAKVALDGILPEDFNPGIIKTPRGYHYYCQYSEGLRNKARIIDGVDIRSEGGYVVAPPSVNENGLEYYSITKELTQNWPHVPNEIIKLSSQKTKIEQPQDLQMFIQGRRDEDLFHVANALVRGAMSVDEIYQVIQTLAENCSPPYPNRDVASKVKSAVERGLRKERNISEEVRHWIMATSGMFLTTDISRALQLTTKEDLKNLTVILTRLKEDGIIEKAGNRAGMYRRIEKDYVLMDWKNATINPININYPLGIHNIFDTYPKNILVIAGIKDAGKTAFFLDFIKRNQSAFNVHYFTNEMGNEELKLRLSAHKDMAIEDWKFHAYMVGGAWPDIVQPDDITIIDYVEVNNEFWSIGEIIKQMHEKLNKGVLLLGLQKSSHATLGRGAEFSIQRPRLYITLDDGIATIQSAKNRKQGLIKSPKGMVCNYEIKDGWKIIPKSKWYFPE